MRTIGFDEPQNLARGQIELEQPAGWALTSSYHLLIGRSRTDPKFRSDNLQRKRLPNMRPLPKNMAIEIESLNAVVFPIRHVDDVILDYNPMYQGELSWS